MKSKATPVMRLLGIVISCLSFFPFLITGCNDNAVEPVSNSQIENILNEQMIVESQLAAHFVAIAEQVGLTPSQINAHLKQITDNSVIAEFWITDEKGHAYLSNTGIDFSFNPDPQIQPQAYIFWPLLTGKEIVVTQEARVREIDNQVFKYVAVAGIDKRRIVQVGLHLNNLNYEKPVEDFVAEHMVAQATIAAHLVAVAEQGGLSSAQINMHLKAIASSSVLDEFWITDSNGHAYLTNSSVDFTFSPDALKQPQAFEFWSLITGTKKVVIQQAKKREIDDQVFKYVGVSGIDKPRIVQVGIHYTYFK